jgi:Mg-chelatase subunit ChlD
LNFIKRYKHITDLLHNYQLLTMQSNTTHEGQALEKVNTNTNTVPNPQSNTVPNPQSNTVPNTVPNPQSNTVPNPQSNTVPNTVQLETKDAPIDDLHIVMIVDKSGSMDNIQHDIRGSINKFIRDQQKLKVDKSTFTLVLFDNSVSTIYEKKLLTEVKELTEKDYQPDGGTALNDAIGMTMKKYNADKHLCVVVVTDGQENASHDYSGKDIKELIDKKEADGWKFIYLSADLATAQQGDKLGMRSANADLLETSCNNYAVGYRGLSMGLQKECSAAVTQIRSSGKMKGMGSGAARAQTEGTAPAKQQSRVSTTTPHKVKSSSPSSSTTNSSSSSCIQQ